jgi:hypothetical protein
MDFLALLTDMAAQLPATTVETQARRTAFLVHKKVFMTKVHLTEKITVPRICVCLSEEMQSIFCDFCPELITPVPNRYHKNGWTHLQLLTAKGEPAPMELLEAVVLEAYCNVAPREVAEAVRERVIARNV